MTAPAPTHDELRADLEARWRPSDAQIEAADAALAATGGEHVFTVHLLVDKQRSAWTLDVVVEPVGGVFATRAEALEALPALAQARHEESGLPVCGGWTRHYAAGKYAVWDDPCSVFPEEQ